MQPLATAKRNDRYESIMAQLSIILLVFIYLEVFSFSFLPAFFLLAGIRDWSKLPRFVTLYPDFVAVDYGIFETNKTVLFGNITAYSYQYIESDDSADHEILRFHTQNQGVLVIHNSNFSTQEFDGLHTAAQQHFAVLDADGFAEMAQHELFLLA